MKGCTGYSVLTFECRDEILCRDHWSHGTFSAEVLSHATICFEFCLNRDLSHSTWAPGSERILKLQCEKAGSGVNTHCCILSEQSLVELVCQHSREDPSLPPAKRALAEDLRNRAENGEQTLWISFLAAASHTPKNNHFCPLGRLGRGKLHCLYHKFI